MPWYRRRIAPRHLTVAAVALIAVFAAVVAATRADSSSSPCPDATTAIGTYCLSTALQTVNGQSTANYFAATRACASQGGELATADELIGAADRVKLAGRLDDDPTKATIDGDPSDGLSDWREMSSTLVTTRSGSDASGTLGVSSGATGDPATGEPNPVPAPADTAPGSLQYVTVIANGGQGGFAGSEPVSTPERFRCAFNAQRPAYVPPPPASVPRNPSFASPASIGLTALGQGGVSLNVSCAADCSYRGSVTMTAADARRFGLVTHGKGTVTLALSSRKVAHLSGGSQVQIQVRLSRKLVADLRYWLGRLKRTTAPAKVVLTVQQTGDAKPRTLTRRLTIRR